jgi:hypothetical protein
VGLHRTLTSSCCAFRGGFLLLVIVRFGQIAVLLKRLLQLKLVIGGIENAGVYCGTETGSIPQTMDIDLTG